MPTNLYLIEPLHTAGGVICGQHMMQGHKKADQVSSKKLVPIVDNVFLKEEGYFTPPACPTSLEPILVLCPSTLLEVSKEEAE